MTGLVNYEKRKNLNIFQSLEKIDCTKTQNYIPIYRRFFNLNETNYNNVNFNHTHYIENVTKKLDENMYKCVISHKGKKRDEKVFFKFAPLIDPVKVMIGKYQYDDTIMTLPQLLSTPSSVNAKILDVNNSAYVDGGFAYLSSQLLSSRDFIHGIKYYGSFLSIKKNFKVNVFDDLEYMIKSDYFNKNKNKLFEVENYSDYFDDEASCSNLPPIRIDRTNDKLEIGPIEQIGDEIFDNVFTDIVPKKNVDIDNSTLELISDPLDISSLTKENVQEHNLQSVNEYSRSVKSDSDSSCSSRTSHTNSKDEEELSSDDESGESGDSDDDTEDSEDEIINATMPQFPVQVICMESCDNTLDELIIDDKLNEEKWLSALMQIIMVLITYQKAFHFTHNDLHTNNIMYVHTKKRYLFYKVNNKHYRVPTFGKIFKIIDFGRAIYKYDGKVMCSDSFSPTGDAATQYNIEPYYNSDKPRLEPNYSFDLCRLACSIFDYLVDEMSEIKDLSKCDPVTRIIVEWCIDDNGINVLYKNNGTDRYPDFKLYKMIARCVHKHTPMEQLKRREFADFEFDKNNIAKKEHVMDIDNIAM